MGKRKPMIDLEKIIIKTQDSIRDLYELFETLRINNDERILQIERGRKEATEVVEVERIRSLSPTEQISEIESKLKPEIKDSDPFTLDKWNKKMDQLGLYDDWIIYDEDILYRDFKKERVLPNYVLGKIYKINQIIKGKEVDFIVVEFSCDDDLFPHLAICPSMYGKTLNDLWEAVRDIDVL